MTDPTTDPAHHVARSGRAAMLDHDPDTLGDMPVFVGLAVSVVAALTATFAIQRQLDRRRGGRK